MGRSAQLFKLRRSPVHAQWGRCVLRNGDDDGNKGCPPGNLERFTSHHTRLSGLGN